MEKVINLLYDIEQKANLIISRTDEQKAKKRLEIEKEVSLLEKKIMDETNKKIANLQAQVNKELENERKALLDDYTKQEEQLLITYQSNHDALMEEVFHHIVGA
jgi:hypothetical protein